MRTARFTRRRIAAALLAAVTAATVVGAASPADAAIILHGPTPVAQIAPARHIPPADR